MSSLHPPVEKRHYVGALFVSKPNVKADSTFSEMDYDVIQGLIPRTSAHLCASYAIANRNLPGYYAPEKDCNSWGRYADSMGEVLLAQSLPAVESATQLSLFPAYSYLRIYCEGSVLRKHTDRPSCEISVTLTLGGQAPTEWPIWVEARGEKRAVILPPGDALVYKGAILPHWRERFDGRLWIQLFLHYVRRDGEFADCRFDGRERLGPIVPGQDPRRGSLHRRFAANDACPCGSGLRYADCHGRPAEA